jgi:hypothetical protein
MFPPFCTLEPMDICVCVSLYCQVFPLFAITIDFAFTHHNSCYDRVAGHKNWPAIVIGKYNSS